MNAPTQNSPMMISIAGTNAKIADSEARSSVLMMTDRSVVCGKCTLVMSPVIMITIHSSYARSKKA